MQINSSSQQLPDTITPITNRLAQALKALGYGETEATLTVKNTHPKRNGLNEHLALVRCDNLVFIIELQESENRKDPNVYVCELRLAHPAPDGGLIDRTLWHRLARIYSELKASGKTFEAPPVLEKIDSTRFTTSPDHIKAFLALVRKKHGAGPYDTIKLRDALLECTEAKIPGRILSTLEGRGWIIRKGDDSFDLVEEGKEPVAAPAPVRKDGGGDDPASKRLTAVTDLIRSQARKRADLTKEEGKLETLRANRIAIDTEISETEKRIEAMGKELLTPDKLAKLDEALADLGIDLSDAE